MKIQHMKEDLKDLEKKKIQKTKFETENQKRNFKTKKENQKWKLISKNKMKR